MGATAISRTSTGNAWLSTFNGLVQRNAETFWTLKNADRWLSLRLESLANVLVFSCALFSSVAMKKGGKAGWGVTQALSVTGLLNWAVRCLTETEQMITSSLRVREIIDVEPEPDFPACSDSKLLESGWPWNGDVSFSDVVMTYGEGEEPALKGVNLKFESGKSYGLVGRTGSGKSSVLLSLFRLAPWSGGISLSGVPIDSIKLETLRKSISIIPQTASVLPGTLRDNLSVSGDADDSTCWSALVLASPSLAMRFGDLNAKIGTLSEGEKSLLSLGKSV